MKKQLKISCLPVAGIQNPYQFLMIKGLQSDSRLLVKSGIDDRFFGILRTAIVQKPDYIHFDWETSYYNRRTIWMTLINVPFFILQIYIVRLVFKCKLVWTPHNIIPHDAKNLKIHNYCRKIFAKNMSWIRLFSDSTIPRAIHQFKCNKARLIVVPEGSYIDYYPNNVSKSESRNYLNIGDSKLVMLYTGFIKPYKGIEDLIEVFNKSFSEEEAILIIAGKVIDDRYFKKIEYLIQKNNIKLINRFIEPDELQYFFNAADIVTLPFKKIENSGSAILAMSFKKAIIAPYKGVLIERLANQNKLLYHNSIEESIKILDKIGNDELERIGEKNYNELLKYKWEDFSKYFR